MSTSAIDVSNAVETLLDALEKTRALNGKQLPTTGRDRGAAIAPLRADLLYVSHLCEKAKVQIMDCYHELRTPQH